MNPVPVKTFPACVCVTAAAFEDKAVTFPFLVLLMGQLYSGVSPPFIPSIPLVSVRRRKNCPKESLNRG